MTTYMLNLIFDASNTAQAQADQVEGRFQEDNGNSQNVLLRSKVWLQTNTPNPGWDTPGIWQVAQSDRGTGAPIRLNALNNNVNQVCIRVQGVNFSTPLSNWVARLTVIVARNTVGSDAFRNSNNNNKPFQTRASPFPPPGQSASPTTPSCVLYDFENPTYQTVLTGASSWVQPMGQATLLTTASGKPATFWDAYAVTVAVTVGQGQAGETDPTNVWKFSHDPDMEIQC